VHDSQRPRGGNIGHSGRFANCEVHQAWEAQSLAARWRASGVAEAGGPPLSGLPVQGRALQRRTRVGRGEDEKGEEEEEKKREQTIPHAYQCKCLPLLWRSFEDYNDTKYPGVVS